MLLSIGMIVKNEEKYLRRCLEAITPILREVDSELIIVDTGSTDTTEDIAREFTDNIFHFEWCNDFSAARNSTLEKAKGTWFMYLDADEIIEDCRNIVNFFISGDSCNYNSAVLGIRSFNLENQKISGTMLIPRLVRLANDHKFINPIHERLNAYHEPSKILDVVANHYGYLIENNEAHIKQKMERNLSIMLTEEKKNPSDCYNLFNISQVYYLSNDLDASLEYCKKGLNYAKEQDHFYQCLFYSHKAQIYNIIGDYHQSLITIDEYFSSKKTVFATDIEMYVYKAQCYTYFNGYNEAIDSYKNYFKILAEYKNGLHNTPDVYCHTICYTDNYSRTSFILRIIDLFIQTENYKQAQIYSKSLDIAELQDDCDFLLRKLNQDVKIMKVNMDFSDLPSLYTRLNRDNQLVFQNIIEQIFNNEEYSRNVAEAFCDTATDATLYMKLMRLRYLYLAGLMTAHDVEVLLDDVNEWNEIYADLVYLAFYSNASIDVLSKKFDAFDFAKIPYINNLCCRQRPFFSTMIFDGDDSSQAAKHLWIAVLHERVLVSEYVGNEEKMALFNEYGAHYKRYLQLMFRREILMDENYLLLPKPLRTGFICSLANEYRASGLKVEYIRCLRNILKSEPGFSVLIQTLIDDLSKQQQPSKHPDFDAYARAVKNNILALCEKNETQKALTIIASYEQLCPDDDDIKILKIRLGNA